MQKQSKKAAARELRVTAALNDLHNQVFASVNAAAKAHNVAETTL